MQQKIKRFYKAATSAPAGSGFAVLLDGRAVRTPAKASLELPAAPLAAAIAAEWERQPELVDPLSMPLNSLACTAIDIVTPRRDEIVADLTDHGGHDLLCYWTDETGDLLRRQQVSWQPLLDWSSQALRAPLRKTCGIAPQSQARDSLDALKRAIEAHGDFELTGLAAAVKAAGSLIVGLALSRGRIDAAEAFAVSQLDELYQSERWGEDSEASDRREALRQELESAALFLQLIR